MFILKYSFHICVRDSSDLLLPLGFNVRKKKLKCLFVKFYFINLHEINFYLIGCFTNVISFNDIFNEKCSIWLSW